MELRQLEHFVAVVEHSGFTAAAGSVDLSQSALSASIRGLERDLGATLFSRTTRRVGLTVAGSELLPAARRLLNEARRAREVVAAVSELAGGSLSVGTVQTLTAVDLPTELARFRRAHPGVEISLSEAPSAQLLEALRLGDVHLAYVARDATPLPADLQLVQEFSEELVLVTDPGHPLAGSSRVSPGRLRDEHFVDFRAGMGLQTVVQDLCARWGLDRRISARVSQMDQALALVGTGLGVAIVPRSVVRHDGLPIARFAGPAPRRAVALLTREPVNPAARVLLDQLTAD